MSRRFDFFNFESFAVFYLMPIIKILPICIRMSLSESIQFFLLKTILQLGLTIVNTFKYLNILNIYHFSLAKMLIGYSYIIDI